MKLQGVREFLVRSYWREAWRITRLNHRGLIAPSHGFTGSERTKGVDRLLPVASRCLAARVFGGGSFRRKLARQYRETRLEAIRDRTRRAASPKYGDYRTTEGGVDVWNGREWHPLGSTYVRLSVPDFRILLSAFDTLNNAHAELVGDTGSEAEAREVADRLRKLIDPVALH